MSIEMENPITPLEKADALGNLVQQMYLAHSMGDDHHFRKVHSKASSLCHDLTNMLDTEQ